MCSRDDMVSESAFRQRSDESTDVDEEMHWIVSAMFLPILMFGWTFDADMLTKPRERK